MSNRTGACYPVYREKIVSHYLNHIYLYLALIILLGFIIRLWGLGNVGLHGDEETSAMPALGILKSGLPIFPSGMFYPRAPLHSYFLALSIWIFGNSEWALRFPSVLAGTLGIFFAFFLGKRFLPPKWNLLFVLVIALNPWMIEMSQTARMYIFFSSFAILFTVLLFKWEESGRWRELFVVLIAFLIVLQFHRLAIFFSFLIFLPCLTQPSIKKLSQGLSFFVLGMIFFKLHGILVSGMYGVTLGGTMPNPKTALVAFDFVFDNHLFGIGLLLLLNMLSIAIVIYVQQIRSVDFWISIVLFTGCVWASFWLQYHVAFILYICAIIFSIRARCKNKYLLLLTFSLVLLFILQLYFINHEFNTSPIRKIIRIFIGSFSIYPYFKFFSMFSIGFVIYIFSFFYAVRKFCTKSPVPDHFIFFIISVLLPLFLMSYFRFYFSVRYSFQLAPFFILSCIAGIYYLINNIEDRLISKISRYSFLIPCVLILVLINPFVLGKTINPKCVNFPDHRGAAYFMQSLHLNPNDLVIAEDVLQQVYYNVKVDYWLRGLNDAKNFLREEESVLTDIYTGTQLIGTGEELERILKSKNRNYIYIIGSGETFDYKDYYLSNGILNIVNKYLPHSEVIFRGCDNKTLIWRFASVTTL